MRGVTINQKATANSTFQTPLSQIISCNSDETILVSDSVNCDGRFVLYSVAISILNFCSHVDVASVERRNKSTESCQSRVLWLSCTATTDESILNSMKKIGCDKQIIMSASRIGQGNQSNSTTGPTNKRLSILSIMNSVHNKITESSAFNEVDFVKGLFRQVKEFIAARDIDVQNPLCIIIDDITALEALVGERLAYAFAFSLKSLQTTAHHPFSIVMRSSHDSDLDGNVCELTETVPLERALVELVDTVITVTPLSSGYSRDVHGRLTISTKSFETNPIPYNYCLTDNQVLVMQITSY